MKVFVHAIGKFFYSLCKSDKNAFVLKKSDHFNVAARDDSVFHLVVGMKQCCFQQKYEGSQRNWLVS